MCMSSSSTSIAVLNIQGHGFCTSLRLPNLQLLIYLQRFQWSSAAAAPDPFDRGGVSTGTLRPG